MRPTGWRALTSAAVLFCLLDLSYVNAQAIGGGESQRALRTQGAYVPYDGMSFSQRYHFETGSYFYFNQDPRTLYWADYFDRLDRAERFGYCPPAEPCFPNARSLCSPRFSFGGYWRY